MRVIGYLPNSIVDGVGIRQVYFLAGCPHHCKGCHNPQSWSVTGGELYDVEEIVSEALKSPYNLTFSGGEPLYQLEELKAVCAKIKPLRTIWVYTGYTWEEINESEELKSILPYVDVLVDGRFEEGKKDKSLLFRGSSNQRIIDVKKSLDEGKIVLWEEC